MTYRRLQATTLVAAAFILGACAKKDPSDDSEQQDVGSPTSTCPADRLDRCAETERRIGELEIAQRHAVDAGDAVASARAGLELNHMRELLALLFNPTSQQAAFDTLESKYEELGRVLDRELARSTQEAQGDAANVSDATQRDERLAALVYHAREVDAVASVMKDFGALYIAASPLDASGKPTYQEVKVKQPWAGYWYPFRGTDLFGTDTSPLKKLDRAMQAAGRPTTAAETEREHRDTFYADSWEGLCAAWAVASTASPEPKVDVTVRGVTFSVADQKALLTKAFERYPTKAYGIRYNGDAETDGTIQDLRPEAFHTLFVGMLGTKGLPFVIDDEPGNEVWSKPVYRVRWTVSKDAEIPNAYVVKAMPWMTRHRPEITNAPTSANDVAAPVYEYRLYVDPKDEKSGAFRVIAGEWLGASLDSHPDSVLLAVPGGELKSGNDQVNAGLDVIKKFLESAP